MSDTIWQRHDLTPFEAGAAARRNGEQSPGPAGPRSSWAERLYRRGWWSADRAMRAAQEGEKADG